MKRGRLKFIMILQVPEFVVLLFFMLKFGGLLKDSTFTLVMLFLFASGQLMSSIWHIYVLV